MRHKIFVLTVLLIGALVLNGLVIAQNTTTLTITIEDTAELSAEQQLALAVEAFAHNYRRPETIPNPAEGEPNHDPNLEEGEPIANPQSKEEFFMMQIRDHITNNIAAYNRKTAIESARAAAETANEKLKPVKEKIRVKLNKGNN